MKSLPKLMMLCALVLTTLTACGSSGAGREVRYSLAEVPGDIRECFTQVTEKPMPGVMTKKQIMALVAKLRKSEQRKTYCGQRLLNLYDSQAYKLLPRE